MDDFDKKTDTNKQAYEEQYDANHDFAIFANKDKAVGGFLDLKEKQNIIDKDEVQSYRESSAH